MTNRCKPKQYCPLEHCYPLIEHYGFGKDWLQNSINANKVASKRCVLSKNKPVVLIKYDEVKHFIQSSRDIGSIESLFTLVWNDKLERGLHYYTMNARRDWSRFFATPLPAYTSSFSMSEDFFALQPRLVFFQAHKNIAKFVPASHHALYETFLRTEKLYAQEEGRRQHYGAKSQVAYSHAVGMVESHGLSRRWLLKMLKSHKISYTNTALGVCSQSLQYYLIDYAELQSAIDCFAPRHTLEMFIKQRWSFDFAQALSSTRIDTRKNWAESFRKPRESSSCSFYTADDFLSLLPKYSFFTAHKEYIVSALGRAYKRLFIKILDGIWANTRAYLAENISTIMDEYADFDYEVSFYYLCDEAVFGVPAHTAMARLMRKKSYKKEIHSQKEIAMDSAKLDTLYLPHAYTSRSTEDIVADLDYKKAVASFLASNDLSDLERNIISLHIDGVSSKDIVRILQLPPNHGVAKKKNALAHKLYCALKAKKILP